MTNPTKLPKAASPSSQTQNAHPKENAAFDPMRQAGENLVALLHVLLVSANPPDSSEESYEESPVGRYAETQSHES